MELRLPGCPCWITHADVSIPFELKGGDQLFQVVLRKPPQIALRHVRPPPLKFGVFSDELANQFHVLCVRPGHCPEGRLLASAADRRSSQRKAPREAGPCVARSSIGVNHAGKPYMGPRLRWLLQGHTRRKDATASSLRPFVWGCRVPTRPTRLLVRRRLALRSRGRFASSGSQPPARRVLCWAASSWSARGGDRH
jgi:hypothetical protein